MTASAGAWDRLGFEIELLAPAGSSRAVLAQELATRSDGTVRPTFHHDTELSLVAGRPVFHHLTPAFEVVDQRGRPLCRLVDDVTIRSDLDGHAVPVEGWFRILSDEPRLLRLIENLGDAMADASDVLTPIAEAFGVKVEARADGRFRVNDVSGASVAMVAPQGGQRQRVCEVVTPPLVGDHRAALDALLTPARELGFTVPAEAAVHVHLDAQPFRSAGAIAKLVHLFNDDRDELWDAIGTNPACRRLGALPLGLIDGIARPDFANLTWDQIRAWLQTIELTKFADCNLLNLRDAPLIKDTVELRILPGTIDAEAILAGVDELKRRLGPLP